MSQNHQKKREQKLKAAIDNMQTFHFSDLLAATTDRNISVNGLEGVYAILDYLTNDTVYTHQIPRAMRETEAALKGQFPELFPDHPKMAKALAMLYESLSGIADEARKADRLPDGCGPPRADRPSGGTGTDDGEETHCHTGGGLNVTRNSTTALPHRGKPRR